MMNLESLAKDLVQKGVLLIAAAGGVVAARAAEKVTTKIPILFVSGFDPVQLGLVDSLNKPGGNATGVSVFTTELTMKRLEIIHKVIPSARSVAFLGESWRKHRENRTGRGDNCLRIAWT